MDWNAWREVINFSTPLAGLIAAGWALWKSSSWVGREFFKPVFGPEGALVKYLQNQQAEAEKQTQEMAKLHASVSAAGVMTAAKLEELVAISRNSKDEQTKAGEKLEDIMAIHRHWVAAARVLVSSDNETVTENLAAIRRITEKYCE